MAIGRAVCLSHTPTMDEWSELYAMAKKQSLVGICFAGVQKLQKLRQNPPEFLYLQWMGVAAKIQQMNEVMTRNCFEAQERFAKDGYRCCILKGQGVAAQYNHDLSALRQSGDIDIWIKGGLDATLKLTENLGQKADVTEQHVHLDIFKGTDVEAHYVPTRVMNPIVDKKLQSWIEAQQEKQFANRDLLGWCTPTAEFNLVYLLLHMYRHLFHEGVGLRQVMDYYFVLQNSTEVDRRSALQTIRELGLEAFAGGVMHVLKVVFGLSEEQMLCQQNEKHGRFLLKEIILSGNMGHYDERLKGKDRSSSLKRFWMVTWHNMRLLNYYPAEVLWGPFARISLWIWRTKNGYRK